MHEYTITTDNIDALCLPLGKAASVLELIVDDLPTDQANALYVVSDLIREGIALATALDAVPKRNHDTATEWARADAMDLRLTIDEVSSSLKDADGLLKELKTVLAPVAIPTNTERGAS